MQGVAYSNEIREIPNKIILDFMQNRSSIDPKESRPIITFLVRNSYVMHNAFAYGEYVTAALNATLIYQKQF